MHTQPGCRSTWRSLENGTDTINENDDIHDDDAEWQLNATIIHESVCLYSQQ